MGYQDRDYYRQESNYYNAQPMKMVYKIIILNVILWLANAFITPAQIVKGPDGNTYMVSSGQITEVLTLHMSDVNKPWLWWKFVTYGFAHSSSSAYHIIGNMLALFFLGTYVEDRYGRNQFLGFYLASIVVGGLFWVFCTWLEGSSTGAILGASGGVTATVILFTLTYPRVTLYLNFLIPVPAWAIGLFLVGSDMYGAIKGEGLAGSNVAYTVHLGSAAFAALYFVCNWNFTRLGAFCLGDFSTAFAGMGRSRIKIHQDSRYAQDDEYLDGDSRQADRQESTPRDNAQREKDARLEAEMRDEVDRILKKISKTGRESITRAEERTLQAASEFFQKKR